MELVLRTNNLTKVFGRQEAVSGVNIHLKKGEIYGFLGPNGAGKTTLMRLVTNLIKPTRGEIELFGEKLTEKSYEVLKRLGATIDSPVFYEGLSGRENLELHCEYMGYQDKKAIDSTIEMVGLKDIQKKIVKEYSLGMKQRLGIARAIVTKPEMLILDEPVNSLDPVGIKQMRNLLKILSKQYGITIMISSHILAEIEQIADTIGVINKGKLIEEISMSQMLECESKYVEIITNDTKKAAFVLESKLNVSNFKILDDKVIRIYDMVKPQSEISKGLIQNDVMIEGISCKTSTLEDYFLKLLNRGVENV